MPPLSATVKYGLLSCLGRKAILRPCLIGALGLAWPAAAVVALPPPELSLVVPPQAASATAQVTARASAAQRRWRGEAVGGMDWVLSGGAAGATDGSGGGGAACVRRFVPVAGVPVRRPAAGAAAARRPRWRW